jgi:predicted aspartyl protease
MPHFTLPFQAVSGPRIDAHIGVSKARLGALQAAGQPIPQLQKIRALVDTGASITTIDPTIISALGIQPTGAVPVHTPTTAGTPVQVNTFDVAVYIPITEKSAPFVLPAVQVVESALKAQGFDALIGRDILQYCLFVYDGRANIISMAF